MTEKISSTEQEQLSNDSIDSSKTSKISLSKQESEKETTFLATDNITKQDTIGSINHSQASQAYLPGITPSQKNELLQEDERLPESGAGGGGDGRHDPPITNDDYTDDGEKEHAMPLLEHLGELRKRIVRCLIVIGVVFFACYGVSDILFQYLALPLVKVMPADTKLIFTSIPEGFFVYLKVAFVAAVFVTSPYIFYQIWAFISPGLYDEERKYIIPLAICSAIFFLGGASFCYFVVFPFAFTFFMSYSTETILAMPSLSNYLSFSLKLLIAFGLIFEMPLFAFFLSRMKLITAGQMRAVRKYEVLVVFIVAAILTPPDVFSQLLMAIPMLILYEISILVAAVVSRSPKVKES